MPRAYSTTKPARASSNARSLAKISSVGSNSSPSRSRTSAWYSAYSARAAGVPAGSAGGPRPGRPPRPPRRGGAGGVRAAALARAPPPQHKHDDIVVQHRRPFLRLREHALGELLRRRRAAVLREQLGQPVVAEEAPLAPHLEQPVGGGEEDVAAVELDLALLVLPVVLDAERQPAAGQRLRPPPPPPGAGRRGGGAAGAQA